MLGIRTDEKDPDCASDKAKNAENKHCLTTYPICKLAERYSDNEY